MLRKYYCPRRQFAPAACLALLAFAAAACSTTHAQNRGAAAPPLVEVITVAPADVAIFAEYPAQTYARDMVEVRGRVAGNIEKWLFKPGSEVRPGDTLYVLDLRPYEAAVEQAGGNLKQSEADLQFARQQVLVLQAEAALATSQANLVKAQQDYERLKPLVEQDAASRQDLDAATASLRAAEAGLRSSTANLEQVRLSTLTQIQSTEGRVESQRAALRNARLNLEYATIRAPIGGLIGDTMVPPGGVVNPASQQPLTTIVPLDPIWVRFKITESEFLKYRTQLLGSREDSLELLLADNSSFPYRGRVTNSQNQLDARTGTLELQASFPNPKHTLLPGQFGRLRFRTEVRKGALAVPQRAVQQMQTIQTVYTVEANNQVTARPVVTGPRVGDDWIIEKGLQAGDRVVVEGLTRIRPGATVRPAPWSRKR
jgi:membrane fusion protein (multidrug efflux system)